MTGRIKGRRYASVPIPTGRPPRRLSQEHVVCRIGLRAKLARCRACAFEDPAAGGQSQHQFRILEDAASAMLDDVQLKQRHVTRCGARRGGRPLAFHYFTVGQFPGGADIVMAYCPAAQDEGRDRFAKNPIRCGSVARLTFVNLRSNAATRAGV
jgi:hypothetical protein